MFHKHFSIADDMGMVRDTPFEAGIADDALRNAIKGTRLHLEGQITRLMWLWLGSSVLMVFIIGVLAVFLYRANLKTDYLQLTLEGATTEVDRHQNFAPDFRVANEAEKGNPALEAIPVRKGILTSNALIDLMLSHYEGMVNFEFQWVEKKNKPGYIHGDSTCWSDGRIYFYETSGYQPDLERGTWITIRGCGIEGKNLENDLGVDYIARLYMPYEAMLQVKTFQDYFAAIDSYAMVFEINQVFLEHWLGVEEEQLPINQWFELPPVPVRSKP